MDNHNDPLLSPTSNNDGGTGGDGKRSTGSRLAGGGGNGSGSRGPTPPPFNAFTAARPPSPISPSSSRHTAKDAATAAAAASANGDDSGAASGGQGGTAGGLGYGEDGDSVDVNIDDDEDALGDVDGGEDVHAKKNNDKLAPSQTPSQQQPPRVPSPFFPAPPPLPIDPSCTTGSGSGDHDDGNDTVGSGGLRAKLRRTPSPFAAEIAQVRGEVLEELSGVYRDDAAPGDTPRPHKVIMRLNEGGG